MAIEIIRFDSGYLLDPAGEVIDQITSAARENAQKAQTLREGEYDITPEGWTETPHILNLLVYANGTGTYRMIPRDRSLRAIDASNRLNRRIPKGRITSIPESSPIIVVTGYYRNTRYNLIQEIIVYKYGPSPLR